MALTLTAYNAPYALDMTQTRIFVRGLLTITASTYAAGGIAPTSLTQINDASGQAVLLATLNATPDSLTFQSISGSGYVYTLVKSTGKIKIQQSAGSAAPLAEIGNGNLPAGVLADVVEFVASWVKQ